MPLVAAWLAAGLLAGLALHRRPAEHPTISPWSVRLL
jgi:hypothetical protein